MPKNLTIEIPDPLADGLCDPMCPSFHFDESGYSFCILGLRGERNDDGHFVPGEKCPQFQGDHHAKQATNVNNTRTCGR